MSWQPVIEQAADIVAEYDTLVTLRQLFYRLVAAELLPNTDYAYRHLSKLTAVGRRRGTFPDLIDSTRWIHRVAAWEDAEAASGWLRDEFRLDRTAGQDVSLYLAVEKRAIASQLETWFGELGIPVLPLGGYTSQGFVDDVRRDAALWQRDAVLIYAGDFDPSGEDIDRDFIQRSNCFVGVTRVALSAEQVERYDLPPQIGKATDSRASAFLARHGRLVQVELDALPPDVLRDLYATAMDRFWDVSEYEAVLARELAERDKL